MLKRFIPFAHAKSIYEIDPSFYKKLNVKFVLADLDNTLDSYKQKTPLAKAKELKENIQAKIDEIMVEESNKFYPIIKAIDKKSYINNLLEPGEIFLLDENTRSQALVLFTNERLYMYCDMVMVSLPGPPPVRFFTSSKSCNVPFIDIMEVSRITGRKRGSVSLKNCCIVDAPSIFAAS
mgnify:CR=1 FL=1